MAQLQGSSDNSDVNTHVENMLTRQEVRLETLERSFVEIKSSISDLAKAVTDRRVTNWPMLITMCTAAVGCILWVTQAQIGNSVNPMKQDLAAFKENLISVAQSSRSDSKDIHDILDSMNFSVGEIEKKQGEDRVRNESQISTITAKFDNYRDVINMNKEFASSALNQLYQKEFGYPLLNSVPYYMRPVAP